MPNGKKYQRGFSLLELLIVLLIVSVLGTAIMTAILDTKKAVPKLQADFAAGRVAGPLAQKFAQDRLSGPKSGMLLVSQDGGFVVDPGEQKPPPGGWKFTYNADTKQFNDGFCFVTVTILGDRETRVCGTARYWVDLTPPPGGGGGSGGDTGDTGDGGGGGTKQ